MNIKNFLTGICIMISSVAFCQNTISGKLTQDDGEPVAFASIVIKGTTIGSTSDNKGNFRFDNIKSGEYVLLISSVGYEKTEHPISVKDGEKCVANCVCKPSALELQSITVTAEKREDDIQKIPVAVTAITAKQIEGYRLWSAKDLTGLAPNLNTINVGNENNLISIRGVQSYNTDNPAVATYVDGVNQFDAYSNITILNDVERIEVLRGPQGTLYGRNAMGGVINIITKQPTNIVKGSVEANVGNFGLQRYNFGIKAPIIKDKLFMSLSGLYNQRNGYFTNTFNNTTFDALQSGGANLQLKYLISNKWSINVAGKYFITKNTGPYPYAANDSVAFAQPFKTNQNTNGIDQNNILQTAATLRYDGDKFRFINVAAYQQNERDYYNVDVDFSSFNFFGLANQVPSISNQARVFTNEFRFSDAGNSKKWKWTVGSYAFTQNAPNNLTFDIKADAAALGPQYANAPFSSLTIATANNYGFAGFGQVSYKIVPSFELTAGIRYDYENKSLTSQTDFLKEPAPQITVVPQVKRQNTFTAFSPKFVATWYAKENITVYGSYTRGFRAGGLNAIVQNEKYIPYNPEYSDNIEAGLKTTLVKNRLNFNVAAFFIDWKDIQTSTFEPGAGLNTAILNSGTATNKGVEAEFVFLPVKGLMLNYQFGYTDAKYSKLTLPNFATGGEIPFNNNKVIMTPQYTSVFVAQYSLPIKIKTQTYNIITRGQWNYIGEQYFDLENRIKQSPYSTVNARVGVAHKNVELFFWGQNLTDTKYLAFGTSFGGSYAMLATPATYGVTLTGKF